MHLPVKDYKYLKIRKKKKPGSQLSIKCSRQGRLTNQHSLKMNS